MLEELLAHIASKKLLELLLVSLSLSLSLQISTKVNPIHTSNYK